MLVAVVGDFAVVGNAVVTAVALAVGSGTFPVIICRGQKLAKAFRTECWGIICDVQLSSHWGCGGCVIILLVVLCCRTMSLFALKV